MVIRLGSMGLHDFGRALGVWSSGWAVWGYMTLAEGAASKRPSKGRSASQYCSPVDFVSAALKQSMKLECRSFIIEAHLIFHDFFDFTSYLRWPTRSRLPFYCLR